jgi:hypothetical protein
MSANASKTKYIIFHNKGKTVDTNGPGANPWLILSLYVLPQII